MYTGFCYLCGIDEATIGLRLTFEEAAPGFLRNDHPQFQELRDLLRHQLHEMQSSSVPRPTWLALDENRVIVEVRLVGKGVPLSARRDETGAYWIVFPFTNLPLKLSPDHPRFRELERYLLQALEHENLLFYVASAEDFYAVDDLLPSELAHRPPQDNAVAVAGGEMASEQRGGPAS
jgi:hypothetical protein